jgi:hypothetical protein
LLKAIDLSEFAFAPIVARYDLENCGLKNKVTTFK